MWVEGSLTKYLCVATKPIRVGDEITCVQTGIALSLNVKYITSLLLSMSLCLSAIAPYSLRCDYSTFDDDEAAADHGTMFKCTCGAVNCRGSVE